MTISISDALANEILGGGSVKASLEGAGGFFIYIFAGPVPADANEALDVTAGTGLHTQLAMLSVDGDDVTELTFAASGSGRALQKAAGDWKGLIDFDGALSGPGAATATFYRLCTAGDDGRGAAGVGDCRVQGTVGESGADMNLTDSELTDNGSNEVGLSVYELRIPG